MKATTTDAHQLILGCQGLVRSIAAKIRKSLPVPVEMDDLIGYGQLGLAQAASEFDPERGVKFSTFSYYRIRGAIYDGLTKMAWFRRSPHGQTKFEQMANEVLRLESDESKESEASNVESNGKWFSNLTRTLSVSYLSSHRNEGGDEDGQGDVVDPSTVLPAAAASRKEISDKLFGLVESLPLQSALIIRIAYFEGHSLQEASDIMGISKSWVSRLHARALEKLAHSLKDLGVDG